MVILSREIGAAYRTRCMSRSHAEQFAACLIGNGLFDDVQVLESAHARGEDRWYVAYRPRNPQARAALLQREQDERAQRARAEEQEYLFVRDGDTGGFLCQAASGEVYQVSLIGCNCGDATYRANPVGLVCKHSVALEHALERGGIGDF